MGVSYTSLDLASPLKRYRIIDIEAGRGLREKILEMGMTPGSEIRVIRNARGHIIVLVRGVSIAISRGIAKKIILETLE